MSEYKSFLANYDEEFANAETPDYPDLPDGVYQGRVERIYLDPNKNTGELALRLEFDIVNNQNFNGRKIFYYKSINSKSIPYLRVDLKRLNIEPIPFSNIENYFPGVLDKIVEVKLKRSNPDANGKTYQNCYINKILGEAPASKNANTSGIADNLPF